MPLDDKPGFGFDRTPGRIATFLGGLMPQWVARRAVRVTVQTDRDQYPLGDPIGITIQFRNRLPVPIALSTPGPRLWGWSVDGELEASDEPRYLSETPSELMFGPWERKLIHREWDGQFKRSGDPDRWVRAGAGTHIIKVFIATTNCRPADQTTVEIAE